ncbi:uncharacterized protein LOC106130503 [Amyelois transitella]|uniref:uncharacterized protein LOC106130503 n=1 Tax=Amyelois transitella TaxID=680683 RepID=UPI00067D42BD|nr:uncharacterized protein LOC106130503 [Amyelois transitella]
MMNKLALFAFCAIIKSSVQSIVGVTYRDKFDFEERYRDPNECNPFYWHPLHLPERCAELFERTIRSKVGAHGPVRIMTKKQKSIKRKSYKSKSFENLWPSPPEVQPIVYEINEMINERVRDPSSPYEQMMDNLRQDISYLPSAPKVTFFPGLGPVALYQQPISKTSKAMIENIAKIYGKNNRRQNSYYPYGQAGPYLEIEESGSASDNKNKTATPEETEKSDIAMYIDH